MSELDKENDSETKPYLKCKNCLQIEPETDWLKNLLGDSVCKHCKKANKTQVWPSSEIAEFVEISLYYSYSSSAEGENKLLMNQMKHLRMVIELLEKATKPICPTCGQPLYEEHLQETLKSLTSEGIQRADRYRANQKREEAGSDKLKLFSVILCCLAAEMILEEHLFALAWTNHLYEESEHIIKALFEGYQGRSGRLSMYKNMELRSYKNLCESLSFGEVYDDWEDVTRLRNKLLHGDISEEAQKELNTIGPEKIKSICDGLLEVSRLDQNDYTRKFSYIYKSAVGEPK